MNALKILFGMIMYGGKLIVILVYLDIASDLLHPIITNDNARQISQPVIQTNSAKMANVLGASS